jgi:hypothetical protein
MSQPATDVDKMIAAMADARDLVRTLHEAVKDARAAARDLRVAVAEAGETAATLAADAVAERVRAEAGARLAGFVDAAADRVSARFDEFGESLLGKETYWARAAAVKAAAGRPA